MSSRDAIFIERDMPYLDKSKSVSGSDFGLELAEDGKVSESETQRSEYNVLESEIVAAHPEAIVDSDELLEENENLDNYMRARDRARRNIVPPLRYSEVDCVQEALNIAETM